MDGMTFIFIFVGLGLAIAAIFIAAEIWKRRRAAGLDSEVTAYVAEGAMSPETARAILTSKATVHSKREVAALIADGMEPDKGISLLNSMAAA